MWDMMSLIIDVGDKFCFK